MNEQQILCPSCGETISRRASVCRWCGRMRNTQPFGSYNGPGTADADGPEIQARKRKKNRTLVYVWIVLLALVWLLAVAGLSYFLYQRFSDPALQEEIQSVILEDRFSDAPLVPRTGEGYEDYEALVSDYFDAFEDADRSDIFALFLPEIQAYYEDDADALLQDQDEWYDFYGTDVLRWSIGDVADYDVTDVTEVAQELGVEIQRAIDVQAPFLLEESDADDPYLFDFTLLQVDGKWYLYYVW